MKKVLVIFTSILLAFGCKEKVTDPDGQQPTPPPPITGGTDIKGYALLSKVCGIWNGPAMSTTALGSFNECILDFRPIHAAQVSAKNELDKDNSLYMSFFVIYDGNEYQVAFRNGGTFSGMTRTSYMQLDSLSEAGNVSYYRFVDFVKREKRTITEVRVWGDSLHIRSYTNKSNTLAQATLHMDWKAKLQSSEDYQEAKNKFGFPQKEMVKDLSTAFDNVTEAVYYVIADDPYPEAEQPYLGKATLSYTAAPNVNLQNGGKVILMVSTKPLVGTTGPITNNFKTRARNVILSSPDNSYTFGYLHPGTYYLYALYDKDGNRTISGGDYVSTTNTTFTLGEKGNTSASTQVNYLVP